MVTPSSLENMRLKALMKVSLAVLPALSAAVPVTSWPLPSSVTSLGALHEATPESPAWADCE